jgi:hypothetical protein
MNVAKIWVSPWLSPSTCPLLFHNPPLLELYPTLNIPSGKNRSDIVPTLWEWEGSYTHYGAFTLDVKSALIEYLGGILGGTQC